MAGSRVLVDLGPLRHSRDFRLLWEGQLVSFFGTQLTTVGVAYQVFLITHSTLQVGLVSLGQLVPLLVGALVGGAILDAFDRRRVLLLTQVLLAVTGVGLAVNAALDHPPVWPLYLVTAVAALLSGVDRPARSAIIPSLVERGELTAAYSLWQIVLQLGATLGPAVAGLLIAQVGLAPVYWIDVATFVVCFAMVLAMRPPPPVSHGTRVSLRSIGDGVRYVRRDRLIASTFLIDLNAMVFGLPRAVFPALAVTRYHGGARTLGLLFAAPGAGASFGAVLSGWLGRVRRQGRAVMVAVMVWGATIVVFGVVHVLWIGLVFLAAAGAADMFSAVFRNTMLQTTVAEEYRGRLSAAHIAVVTGGPRLGDAETGLAAAVGGAEFAVWSGGLLCVIGALAVAWRLPELLAYETRPAGGLTTPPP